MFGSRTATAVQTREVKYSLSGANSFEGLLLITGPANGQQNTDDLLVSDIMYPDAAGKISVSVSKGSNTQTSNHYYQLNCMEIEEYEGGTAEARDFSEVSDLTGIVLTKMDGTSKGGIAVAIAGELNVPVKYVGVGETKEDLLKFDPQAFSSAMFEGGEDGDE